MSKGRQTEAKTLLPRRREEVKNPPQNGLSGAEQRLALFKSPLLCQAELRGRFLKKAFLCMPRRRICSYRGA